MKHHLTTLSAILLTLSPNQAWPFFDQSGFPARCHTYAVCNDEDLCIQHFFAFSKIIVLEMKNGYLMKSSDGDVELETALFQSRKEAESSLASNQAITVRRVLIPNNEVADAVGYDVFTLATSGTGELILLGNHSKMTCSRMRGT